MKAITLTQPWATLVAIGAKHFETRDWRTNHTGILAITAGKTIPSELGGERGFRATCGEQPFFAALSAAGYANPASLPRGEVVAITTLRGCYTTNLFTRLFDNPKTVIKGWDDEYEKWEVEPALHERAFGDYGPDRYAWALDNVIKLADGEHPCRGWQKVWNLPDEIAAVLLP